jgi:predicted nuclease of predicted toxin-antitoxin system
MQRSLRVKSASRSLPEMKFKTDENLSVTVAELLRQHGHDAMSIDEQDMSGFADANVAEVVKSEGRVLVTLDLDFSNIQNYPPAEYPGIIVLRPPRQDNATVQAVLLKVLPLMTEEKLLGKLWIVEDQKLRVRDGC